MPQLNAQGTLAWVGLGRSVALWLFSMIEIIHAADIDTVGQSNSMVSSV